MREPDYASVNGRITRSGETPVCLLMPALLDSFGVYESARVEHGVAFHLEDHLQRLKNSAALLEMPLPAPPATIRSWVQALLARSDRTHCLLRLVVLGPTPGDGPTCTIWMQDPPSRGPDLYQHGVEMIALEGRRYLPQVKSLNTLLNYLGRREASRRGVHEALLHHDDLVTEGASSNFFIVQDGALATAPEELVLPGVTRALALRLARETGIPTTERRLHFSERGDWDEAFITSTSRKVLPVTSIDGQAVGDGLVGPVTGELMAVFGAYDRQYLSSHSSSQG